MGKLKKDISKLLEAGIIDAATAERIESFYKKPSEDRTNRLFLIFGILGSILIGLGAILIIAHNWDRLSMTMKTIFAFLPLVMGQLACGYVLFRKPDQRAWNEGSSTFLFFATGASISLISQIYQIPGNLTGYLLTWMLLVLPLIYLMRSSMTSLLYLVGITAYGIQFYDSGEVSGAYYFWLLLLAGLPFYIAMIRRSPKSNFTHFHHWFIALSVTAALGIIAHHTEELMYLGYLLMFGGLQLTGYIAFRRFSIQEYNGLRIVGSVGTIVMLVILSFRPVWDDIRKLSEEGFILFSPEALLCIFLATALIYLNFAKREKSIEDIPAIAPWVYLVAVIIFIIGIWWLDAYILINVLLLIVAINKIRAGVQLDDLVILNFGMLILALLIASRFFDSDISFVIRGILFVLLGAGFFLANYFLLKRRKHA